MKIAIVGFSGAGKSTLARFIGAKNQLPVCHLDQIQFTANWRVRDFKEAEALAAAFMTRSDWVIEGNYPHFKQKERFEAADQIIFLNFSRWRYFGRILRRYFKYKGKTRPDSADSCEESLNWEFFCWVLFAGRSAAQTQQFRELLAAYPEKTQVIKNQRQLDRLYCQLTRNIES